MTPTINHIAIAVPSIERFLDENSLIYGAFVRGPLLENVTQGVREMFISDGSTVLELLEPLGPGSPVAGALKSRPFGTLLHVAVDVDSLESTIVDVEAAGGRSVVGPVEDVAFEGRRIAFVMLNGHVTELIERAKVGVTS